MHCDETPPEEYFRYIHPSLISDERTFHYLQTRNGFTQQVVTQQLQNTLVPLAKRDCSPAGFGFASRVNTSEELGARDTCVSPAHTSLPGWSHAASSRRRHHTHTHTHDQPISFFQTVTGKTYSERYPLSLREGYSCRC